MFSFQTQGAKVKIEAILRITSFCLIISVAVFSGCAAIQHLGESGSAAESANYALASNGSTVSASDYTSGHDPYTAVNGVTSSLEWDNGEGWECNFDRRHPRKGGWSRLDPRSKIEFGAAWLEVQFNGPKLINKVTVYTLDSAKYPAAQYGIRDAWVQLWQQYGWTNVGEVENAAIVDRDSLDRQPVGGKMVFKFSPTTTDRIRLVVLQSNDFKSIKPDDDRRVDKSVARVVEIQATGLEKASRKASSSSGTARVKPAPEFVLQDMSGEWVRLSNFKGKVVILTFWAAWSPDAKRQVRDLARLHDEYKDRDVVVIGISVNEGGAERIRPFVESSGLNYTILIADTGVKTAYGGIGKLPSNFIIDQKGNIYREYFEYKGKHILELDIKKLLSSE